jgi:histidine ammonia-lyase
MSLPVVLGDGPLPAADVVAVARQGAKVCLSENASAAIEAARAHIDRLASSGVPVYGVSTGFGALATRYIEPAKRHQLQRSLVRSHAAGSGPEVETEVVRALMLLRLATLCTGRTGVRLSTVRTYAGMLNAGPLRARADRRG